MFYSYSEQQMVHTSLSYMCNMLTVKPVCEPIASDYTSIQSSTIGSLELVIIILQPTALVSHQAYIYT